MSYFEILWGIIPQVNSCYAQAVDGEFTAELSSDEVEKKTFRDGEFWEAIYMAVPGIVTIGFCATMELLPAKTLTLILLHELSHWAEGNEELHGHMGDDHSDVWNNFLKQVMK